MLTLFSVFKFLHVVAAIVWVGGVITMTLLNVRLASTRNSAAMAALSSVGGFIGQRVFGPAAAITLLAGIATALNAGFQMRSLWIIWGFAGHSALVWAWRDPDQIHHPAAWRARGHPRTAMARRSPRCKAGCGC